MVVANAAFTVIAATPSIPTPLGQVRVARDVVNDDMQDNARTSHEMVADCSSHGRVSVKTYAE